MHTFNMLACTQQTYENMTTRDFLLEEYLRGCKMMVALLAGATARAAPTRLVNAARTATFRMTAAATGQFEIELFSPAKLSLFTRVLGRQDDGFHDSASLFQAVTLGDTLQLARIPATRSTFAGVVRPSRKYEPIKQHVEFSTSSSTLPQAELEQMPTDQSNWVTRALALFRTKLAERDGGSLEVPRFRAHLSKSIPLDAGLGGAASNAATALYGANELCGRPASPDELMAWGSELSNDVACFLGGTGSAYCTGRAVFLKGDTMHAMEPLARPPSGSVYLVTPDVKLSTPAIFRRLADERYASLSTIAPTELRDAFAAADGFATSSGGGGADTLYMNDLDAPAVHVCPELGAIQRALREDKFVSVTTVSGAGTSLYAVGLPHGSEAPEEVASRLAHTCEAASGVRVRVWSVDFATPSYDKATHVRWYTQSAATI